MRIAISGAGVAGPALAYWLLRAGHEPTLIEAAPTLRTGGYMIDFWGVGFDVAERMGLTQAIRGAGYEVQEIRYLDKHGRRAGVLSTRSIQRSLGDRFVSLPRGDLAALIHDASAGRAETLFGTSISAMGDDGDRVRVRLSSGEERTFDLVIGADGQHSNVRRLAFGPQPAFERPLGYYVAAFVAQGYHPRDELTYVSYGLPGRQISRFAQRDDRTMFLFVVEAERLGGAEPTTLASRRAVLETAFNGVGWEWPAVRAAMRASPELYFDRVSQIAVPSWSAGRVALLGDAAACVSLLAGEGAGLGLTEAYVLAGELAGCGGDHAAAFARYESRLRSFVEGKQAAARRFARAFTPHTATGVWIRNKVVQLMGIPGLAKLFVGAQLKDDFTLPDYRL